MTISLTEQIKLVKEEQKFDLESGEFHFTDWEKLNVPCYSEQHAWEVILNIRKYRHDNHLLYVIFEPRFDKEGKFWDIWTKREIVK